MKYILNLLFALLLILCYITKVDAVNEAKFKTSATVKFSAKIYGSKVIDPKLSGSGPIEITYKLIDPAIKPNGYSPRVELIIFDEKMNEISCLVNKNESQSLPSVEIKKTWDGKWGKDRNGNNTVNIGEYVTPQKCLVYLYVYEKPSDTIRKFEKAYSFYVVRLGITEIDFGIFGDHIVYNMMFHKNTFTGTNVDYTIPVNHEWLLDSLDSDEPACKKDVPYPSNTLYNYPIACKKNAKIEIFATSGSKEKKCIIPNGCPTIKFSSGINANKNPYVFSVSTDSTPKSYSFVTDNVINKDVAVNNYPIDFTFYYEDKDDFNGNKIILEPIGQQKTSHIIYTVYNEPKSTNSYIELLGWSTKILEGVKITKDFDIINACYNNFHTAMPNGNVLTYGVRDKLTTQDVLDYNGGMCKGLQITFADLVGTQGITLDIKGYYIQTNSETTPILDSTCVGDDGITPAVGPIGNEIEYIHVGKNGVNNTICHANDTPLISTGCGVPDFLSIIPKYYQYNIAKLVLSTVDCNLTDDHIETSPQYHQVIYNGKNGVVDVSGKTETWDKATQDTGLDGLADVDENGYNKITNPDPNKDDYNPVTNPTGTEGNGAYDCDPIDPSKGEPFTDTNGNGMRDIDFHTIPFGEGCSEFDIEIKKTYRNWGYPYRCISPTKSPSWSYIVITSAGLNLSQPNPVFNYRDVDTVYPNFVDPTDITEKSAQHRWLFGAPFDGHALVFYKDPVTHDVWMYDPTFRGGPWKNLFLDAKGNPEIPSGVKTGIANNDFFTQYYQTAVPYHLGTVRSVDAGGKPIVSVYTVKTSIIPLTEVVHVWN